MRVGTVITMTESMAGSGGPSSLALLQLLRFSSPTLPIGGFAWSQGLETAIERSWVRDLESLIGWLRAVLNSNFARQELPVLKRLLASPDQATEAGWNEFILALRETSELRSEDIQTGRALRRLACSLGITDAQQWPSPKEIAYVTAYAQVCRHYRLDFEAAAVGMIWNWLDNQVAAAIKLLPLGQTDGQRAISALSEHIGAVLEAASTVANEDIGISLPGQVMASMLHETQYSRLFRS